jgi:hypothetical protein
LVSCVVSVFIAFGQSRCRTIIASCHSCGVIEKMLGSAPTSLSEVSRDDR